MKRCSKCQVEKSLDQFNKKRNGKQPWCRECNRERSRQYYAENPRKHRRAVRNRNAQVRTENCRKLIDYLRTNPCKDCGEDDIVVLEFDHLRDKAAAVSSLLAYSWRRVEEEIAKCEVVCANCHRRRTAKRGNYYRYVAGL